MADTTEGLWVVSSAPHIRSAETTPRIMWQVVLALAPAGLWALFWFGWPTLWVIALSVGAAVATEALVQWMANKPITVSDGSAVVTGLLLAFVLPSQTPDLKLLPWYVPVVGAVSAIAIAKHCFGGLGQNVWNPALVGRGLVQVSFPAHVSMPRWPAPWLADATSQATPLAKESADGVFYGLGELALGTIPGSLGEVSALLLIAGGVYLIVRRYVDWRLVASYLGAFLLLVLVLPPLPGTAWAETRESRESRIEVASLAEAPAVAQAAVSNPAGEAVGTADKPRWSLAFYHLLAGGLMLGAFFMASDMCTSPLSRKGQVIFGLGCGALTALFRFYSGMPEGVCYSILLMNSATPLIDRHTRPRLMGSKHK